MQKLENKILQAFLDDLIETLKDTNYSNEWDNKSEEYNKKPIFDIPFLASSLWQAFREESNTYSDFIKCLNKAYNYQIRIVAPDNDYYGICKAIVDFYKSEELCEGFDEYQYEINFMYDPRDWGYCQCIPDMKDYREDKDCCGHGCDWWAPAFEIRKSFNMGKYSWEGDEHDYWDFEDEFYMNDKELAEKKENEDKEREIEELRNRIKADQKRLVELEGK